MVSKTINSRSPLSIDVDDEQNDQRKGKSLIYKPEIKGRAPIQNYSSQTKSGVGKNTAKSPITLQLTEIIEKFKPSFVEESHEQESPT